MFQLLSVGNQPNIPTKQFYVESEEEIKNIENAPTGSIVIILSKEDGLRIKMLHSSGEWIDI